MKSSKQKTRDATVGVEPTTFAATLAAPGTRYGLLGTTDSTLSIELFLFTRKKKCSFFEKT
jgi:hypothetical protein